MRDMGSMFARKLGPRYNRGRNETRTLPGTDAATLPPNDEEDPP